MAERDAQCATTAAEAAGAVRGTTAKKVIFVLCRDALQNAFMYSSLNQSCSLLDRAYIERRACDGQEGALLEKHLRCSHYFVLFLINSQHGVQIQSAVLL